jgi:RTX calcium-binding nonapeptide repeat (4 copies)
MNRKTVFAAAALAAMATSIAVPVAAASPTVRGRVVDGVLRVSGTPFADRFALRVSGADPNQLQLDIGDDGSADDAFGLGSFAAIVVDGGSGDDFIRLDTANGAFTTAKPTFVVGDRGDDTLIGGSGNETFFGDRGDDFVDGNGGNDTAFLGEGNDTFVWDPGDANDVVEGQSGFDTHIFNGAGGNEIFAATATGHRVAFTRNTGNIVMDLNSIEALDVRALDGADSVTINDLTGTDLTHVDVNLAKALGGTASDNVADTVKVVGTDGVDTIAANASSGAVTVNGLAARVRVTSADPALDTLVVDTRARDDHVAIDPAVPGLIQVSVQ